MSRQNIFPLILMIGLSLIPVMSIHIPRALSFMPVAFGLGMSLWWVFAKGKDLAHSKPYKICILSICLLCIISVLWSIAPWEVYRRALKISAILVFSIPALSLVRSISQESIKPYLWLFPVGVTIATLLCSFELSFDMPLYQIIHTVGSNYSVNTAAMNRGVVCCVLAFFAALLCIRNMDSSTKIKYFLLLVMSISIITMLSLTQSQSGQLSFVFGILTFMLFPSKSKYSYAFLTIAIISAMALTPFIVNILFVNLIDNAQEIPWLKDGYAGDRLEIWDFVMRYALQSPVYGYGMDATRFVTDFSHNQLYRQSNTVLHPHNFSIQIWMEFGIIGVILASVFFIFLIHKISQIKPEYNKAIIALLVATLTTSSIGYGLWQSWWLGEFIYLTMLCALFTNQPNATKAA